MNTETKRENPWLAHVQAYRTKHECTYAEALKASKSSYKRSSPVKTKKVEKEEPEPEPQEVPTVPTVTTVTKQKRVYRRKKVVEKADKTTQTSD